MKRFNEIILAGLFSVSVSAQQSNNNGSGNHSVQDKIDVKNVYWSAYEIAIEDGKIDKKEKAILKTLQNSLELSIEDITALKIVYEKKQHQELDQSGRWPLVIQNMAWGAGLYGWAIPYIMDAEDFKWYIGTEMLSLGGAFYLTYQYTKKMEIPHARAQMMRAGSGLGFRYGWGINTLLNLWDEEEGSKASTLVLMTSVPTGIYAGDFLYKKWNPSNGQGWVLTLWGDIGSYTVRQIHHMLDEEPREPGYYEDDNLWEGDESVEYQLWQVDHDKWGKRQTLFVLSSYPLAVYLGQRYFGQKSYTFGDALMLFQGRWLGWIYGVLMSDLLDLEMEKVEGRFVRTATTIGGTLIMDRFIRDRDYTFGQSILSVLGTSSGMAFGLGAAIIMEVENFETAELMMMVGGIAGLYLSDSILKVKSESTSFLPDNDKIFSIIPSFQMVPKSKNYKNKFTLIPSISFKVHF